MQLLHRVLEVEAAQIPEHTVRVQGPTHCGGTDSCDSQSQPSSDYLLPKFTTRNLAHWFIAGGFPAPSLRHCYLHYLKSGSRQEFLQFWDCAVEVNTLEGSALPHNLSSMMQMVVPGLQQVTNKFWCCFSPVLFSVIFRSPWTRSCHVYLLYICCSLQLLADWVWYNIAFFGNKSASIMLQH